MKYVLNPSISRAYVIGTLTMKQRNAATKYKASFAFCVFSSFSKSLLPKNPALITMLALDLFIRACSNACTRKSSSVASNLGSWRILFSFRYSRKKFIGFPQYLYARLLYVRPRLSTCPIATAIHPAAESSPHDSFWETSIREAALRSLRAHRDPPTGFCFALIRNHHFASHPCAGGGPVWLSFEGARL